MTSKPRILLVDDNVALLNALARLLRSPEYDVLKANSASQAWEVLAQYPDGIDVIISDNEMPGERGIDFLKSVKQLYPRVIRIMLTGKPTIRDVQSSVNECEVFRFYTKPWNADELQAGVQEGLRRSALQRSV